MKILASWLCTTLLLFYTPVLAQPEKGSFVVNPQIVVSEWAFKTTSGFSRKRYVAGVSAHYYINNRFAMGLWASGDYLNYSPKNVATFPIQRYSINISPEVHYSILDSRFTPFIRIRIGEINYSHEYIDNPAIPERQKKFDQWVTNDPFKRSSFALGAAYSIKNRFALTGQASLLPFFPDAFSNTMASVGCQFVLNVQ